MYKLFTILLLTVHASLMAQGSTISTAESVAQSNNSFGLQMYNSLSQKTSGNLIFSPYSISSAFSIIYPGAEGKTAAEIQKVMRYSKDPVLLNSTFAQLNRHLTNNNRTSSGDFRMVIANSLWIQNNVSILPEFSQMLLSDYQMRVRRVDFAMQPEAAQTEINSWVKERTYGRISNIVSSIDRATKLILVNTIYMKAQWQHVFNRLYTRQGTFFPDAQRTLSVPMIEDTNQYAFLKRPDFSVIELPYQNPEGSSLRLSMVIALPNSQSGLSDLESSLTIENLQDWIQNLEMKRVKVILPKFTMDYMVSLKEILQKMGMITPFSDAADFSKMTDTKNLSITQVLHKAFISLDESGTEVAAATSISIGATSVPSPIVEVFKADHPFLFFIIDRESAVILFIGRLVNPG